MPKLIKNISASYQEPYNDDVSLSSNITVEYDDGDYQKVAGWTGFLQDYSQVDESEIFNKPANFGLAVNKNKTFIELEISY
jgi:hypothetical protein